MYKYGIIVVMFLLLCCGFVNGQNSNQFQLGASGQYAFPLNDFSDVAASGVGLVGTIALPVAQDYAVSINAGYIAWNFDETGIVGLDAQSIPLFVRGQHYLSEAVYVAFDAGADFYKLTKEVSSVDSLGFVVTTDSSDHDVNLLLAPVFGLKIPLGNAYLDVSAKLVVFPQNTSRWSLSAGVWF